MDAARGAARHGQLRQAESICEGYIATRGLGDSVFATLLADVYFRDNQPQQAFAVLAPFCRRGADENLLLRASLAAARRGIVFQGQRRFLMENLHDSLIRDVANYLPQGESAHALEVISCLEIGRIEVNWDIEPRYYLRETLRLDPGNPAACMSLADLERREHHYALAAQVYDQGIARADGDMALFLTRYRDDCQYMHRLRGG